MTLNTFTTEIHSINETLSAIAAQTNLSVDEVAGLSTETRKCRSSCGNLLTDLR
ncbi:MAG TPA: hypothetical protein VE710_13975 [Candidatus Bathyarchaeia archaeon]|nr:hypothetical protein [Candidatus Bathyarchaeia archaeon]